MKQALGTFSIIGFLAAVCGGARPVIDEYHRHPGPYTRPTAGADEDPQFSGVMPGRKLAHKGHRKFIIDGQEIWALNQRSAERKANR